ncbi:MAG: LysR family transcriptional regulator [Alphaproteobacteria bacterium]
MKRDLDWQDLRLFLAVARQRGLSPAAQETGLSPATLGRRMAGLEAVVGRALFDRWPHGYSLTAEGQALLEQAEAMERAAAGVARWRDRLSPGRTVRVSAGSWMTRFLAENVAAVHRVGDSWTLDLSVAHLSVDIGRRHADVGIRNRRPEEPWLAGRRVSRVAFAVYRRGDATAPAEAEPWIGGVSGTRSAIWLAEQTGARFAVTSNDPRAVLDLVRAGVGRSVFPCFVGDAEPGLVRVGPPVAELTSEQWLVVHHEERHDPAVHAAADRIAALIGRHRAHFLGRTQRNEIAP